MSNTKKILLVGGKGLLGKKLEDFLTQKAYHCTSISTKTTPSVDFCNREQVFHFLDSFVPATIINLAALTNVDLCEQNPAQAYILNTTLPKNIADWLNSQKNETHFIQISTDMVYDHEGFNLENNTCVRNHYAGSKLAGEFASLTYSHSTVLRVNFFGKSQLENRPSYSDWIFNNLKQKNKINIFQDVDFSALSMTSLCAAIEKVIRSPHSGVFNVGASTQMSKADFCVSFANGLFDNAQNYLERISIDKLNLKALRPKKMAMNNLLFEKTFDFKFNSLEEEINLTVKEYK